MQLNLLLSCTVISCHYQLKNIVKIRQNGITEMNTEMNIHVRIIKKKGYRGHLVDSQAHLSILFQKKDNIPVDL